MNVTKKQFDCIAQALALLPTGADFMQLSEADRNTILSADTVMIELLRKRQANNERTAQYIAEKRRTDKQYARPRRGGQ